MSNENIVRYSLNEIRERIAREGSKTNFKRLAEITGAEIEAQMRNDPDWADFIDIDWSKAKVVYPVEKHALSIRLDSDGLDFFKSQGKGYQTRINAVLRTYVEEVKKLKNPAE